VVCDDGRMDPTGFPVRQSIRLPRARYREGYAFFLTLATHARHRWFAKHPELTKTAVALLLDRVTVRHSELYAWCFMPDHVHLVVQDVDVVDLVRGIKGAMTPLARRWDAGRRLWQRSYYDHALRREEDLRQVSTYVWENPLRAGLVVSPADYPWSGSGVWPDWRSHYPAPTP